MGEGEFFGDDPSAGELAPSLSAPAAEAEDPNAARARLHDELVEAGVPHEDTREILAVAAESSAAPGLMTEILNQLAFETEADLEHARLALAELWALEQQQAAQPADNDEAARDV